MAVFFSRREKCKKCDGTGKVKDETAENGEENGEGNGEEKKVSCPACRGRGRVVGPSMM